MSRRAQENIVALAILGVFVAVIAMSLGYGPRARLVPIPVAVIGIILVLIQLIWQNLRPAEDLHVDLLEVLTRQGGAKAEKKERAAHSESAKAQQSPRRERKEAAAYALILGFLAAVVLLGPIPAMFLLTFAYFALSRHYSPARSFVYSAVFTLSIYLLFVVALEVQLYHGVLEPVVERLR